MLISKHIVMVHGSHHVTKANSIACIPLHANGIVRIDYEKYKVSVRIDMAVPSGEGR